MRSTGLKLWLRPSSRLANTSGRETLGAAAAPSTRQIHPASHQLRRRPFSDESSARFCSNEPLCGFSHLRRLKLHSFRRSVSTFLLRYSGDSGCIEQPHSHLQSLAAVGQRVLFGSRDHRERQQGLLAGSTPSFRLSPSVFR